MHQKLTRTSNYIETTTHSVPVGLYVLLVRLSVLLLFHLVIRGHRWCRVRRTLFGAWDLAALWADGVFTALCRQHHIKTTDVSSDVVMALFAHDLFVHLPCLLFVQTMEKDRKALGLLLSCAEVLQRSTMGVLRGKFYFGLCALSLRHVWVALSRIAPRPRSNLSVPEIV